MFMKLPHAATNKICVEVFGGAECKPSWAAFPIPITIPIPNGPQAPITLMIDVLGKNPCVSIKLDNNYPRCSNN